MASTSITNYCQLILVLGILTTTSNSVLLALYDFDFDMQRSIVMAHNHLRQREPAANMQEMVWDDRLAALSKAYASTCNAEHSLHHTRSDAAGFAYVGENIWWSTEQHVRRGTALESIVRDFYNEKPFYHFASTWCRPGEMCGHYTQVVWASSCAVGCAASYCDGIAYGNGINHGHVYICNYGPGGNAQNQQPYVYGRKCSGCEGRGCIAGLCGCADNEDWCESWARANECHANPAYMHHNCRRACGLCTPETTTTATSRATTARPKAKRTSRNCVDKHLLCPFWAGRQECRSNSAYMQANCYSSCHADECSSQGSKFAKHLACANQKSQCSHWASIGECQRNPEFMKWKCRRACNQCRF